MANVQEKKLRMKSHKPKGLRGYFEQLIDSESEDYCEQVAKMENIKHLIKKIMRT